jgi:hypothetical protein
MESLAAFKPPNAGRGPASARMPIAVTPTATAATAVRPVMNLRINFLLACETQMRLSTPQSTAKAYARQRPYGNECLN